MVFALLPTFGLAPLEFSQASLYLLDYFFAPTLILFFWLFLSFLRLLFSKILVAAQPFSYLLVRRLANYFSLAPRLSHNPLFF